MKQKIILGVTLIFALFSQCTIQKHLCPCDSLAEDSILGYHLKMESEMWTEKNDNGESEISLMVRVEALNEAHFPTDLTIDQFGVSFANKDGLSNYFTSHQVGTKPNIMEFYAKPVHGVQITDTVNIAIQIVKNHKEVNFLKNDSLFIAQ